MTVLTLRKRFLHFVINQFISKSKLHTTKIGRQVVNDVQRNISARKYCGKSAGPILYKINLARFYNGSKPMYNVSTYENLVNQKSSGNSEKKCAEQKEHPGK